MKNPLVIMFLAVGTIAFTAAPAIANQKQAIVEVPPKSRLSCDDAIANVKDDLTQRGFFRGYSPRGNSEAKVVIDKDSIESRYEDFPANRTTTISFDTYFANDLHNSPKLMATLASQIMSECRQVGIVVFAAYAGSGPRVGYFPDNTARTFIAPPYKRGMFRQKWQWGYYYLAS